MRPRWRVGSVAVALSLIAASVVPAYAHGFGERYDLPLPLWMYLIGAGAAVAFSFVIIGLLLRNTPGLHGYARLNLLQWPAGRLLVHPATLLLVKVASALAFLLVIAAGVYGVQNPNENLAPTMVWVIWWVGLAYVSALVGNLWALLNPWKIIFSWKERLFRWVNPEGTLSFNLPYPRWLGVWPGVALFLGFAWVETVFPGSARPLNLGLLAVGYSLITWAGMVLFGKHVWLRHGEAFSIAFAFLARFAPTEVRVVDSRACEQCSLACQDKSGECVDCYECFEAAEPGRREVNLRPFAAGLLRDDERHLSQVAFVLLMLATVTFDGFTATPTWASLVSASSPFVSAYTEQAGAVVASIGLALFPLIFAALYIYFAILMALSAQARGKIGTVVSAFAYSLIPIALAYHLAHFLSFLLIQGQLVIPLASDPLGYGWDVLGTADYRINIAIVNARFAWFSAVFAIVVGHIIAVYLSHIVAMRTFGNHRLALRSQYPMLVLMVGYTVISLWILAQPITEV